MDFAKRTFGEGPPPFPLEKMTDLFEVYTSDKTSILTPKPQVTFNLFEGSHDHSDFEFLVPYSSMKHVGIENKSILCEPRTVLPINSHQPHGPRDTMLGVRFLSLSIEKSFFEEISRSFLQKAGLCFKNQSIVFNQDLEYLIELFKNEYKAKQTGYELILGCLSTQIVVEILRQTNFRSQADIHQRDYLNLDPHIKRTIELLQDQYNQELSLEEVAKVANLSPYHFIRVFKLQTGKTPFAFLLDLKLQHAQWALKSGKLTVSEVGYACGFKSVSHFSTVFKKKFGISPSEYRATI